MNLKFVMFYVILSIISEICVASTGKFLCENYNANSSKFDITVEVDLQKKALALVMKSGFSILFHEKTIINKTTGQRIEQFEGKDIQNSFVQFGLLVKKEKNKYEGQLYYTEAIELINFKCDEIYSLPHQRFINIAVQDEVNI